jgi:hypothetical protein
MGSIFVDRGIEASLASRIIPDAYADRFDTALIVSKRVDLAPIIIAVQKIGKTVDVAFFQYDIDPVNPLHSYCDGTVIVTNQQVIRATTSGPKPFYH